MLFLKLSCTTIFNNPSQLLTFKSSPKQILKASAISLTFYPSPVVPVEHQNSTKAKKAIRRNSTHKLSQPNFASALNFPHNCGDGRWFPFRQTAISLLDTLHIMAEIVVYKNNVYSCGKVSSWELQTCYNVTVKRAVFQLLRSKHFP